ncbi:MAG: RNA polymerase sigma-70 factor [Bacteroides sp.]
MKENSFDDDRELLSLLNKGDKKGFDAIFHKYYQPLCGYAYKFVCLEDVEEIVQDVLLWVWENHSSFFVKSSLQSYLYRSVYMRCINRIEQNMAKQRIETVYWERYLSHGMETADDYQTEELLNRIRTAINRLPEKYRETFVLHRFKDLSYKEIAAQLNVSPKTVDYRIQQALKLLREDLREYFPLLLLLCHFVREGQIN